MGNKGSAKASSLQSEEPTSKGSSVKRAFDQMWAPADRQKRRLRRGGYLPTDHPSFENLAMIADQRLYRSIVRQSVPCPEAVLPGKGPIRSQSPPKGTQFCPAH